MSLAAISLFVLPVDIFTFEMLGFQPLLLAFLLNYIIISLIDTLRRKWISSAFLFSLSLFVSTIVNDIMLANSAGSVYNSYTTQISFQLFILAMALTVVVQWIQNQKEREKLEASLRFKNRVLSIIAHDLKAPIASVAQFTELITSKPELISKTRIMNSLKESSQAALTMLDNLLYWGRNESESLKIKPEVLEMHQQMHEVSLLYQYMANQKEIEYSVDIEKNLKVKADPVLLHIILRNLLANAIKFTGKGGKIKVEAVEQNGLVHCSVSDNGVGMKESALMQFRNEGHIRSTVGTDQEIGTGLGLQLINDLLNRSGGKLEIKSREGEGSIFSFTLPIVKNQENENI